MKPALQFSDAPAVHRATGQEVCVSDWLLVDQARINLFAQTRKIR